MSWDYATYEYTLSAALLACAMFGMGSTLGVQDFLGVLKSPRGLFLVIGIQILVMPTVAIALARIFSLPAGISVGMVLVAALPGGLFSNVLTFLGRGNVALSVSATAICTVGCLVTSVFVLKVFSATQLPSSFSMPAGRILTEVALCLLLPLVLGMIVYRRAPRSARTIANVCVRVSVVLLMLVVSAAVMAGRFNFAAFGWKPPLVLVLFVVIALWVSYGVAFLVRLTMDDAFTVVVEVVVRNAHLGILLKAALFPSSDKQHLEIADGVLYTVLWYGFISLFIACWEVFAKRHRLGPIFRRLPKGRP